MYLQWQFDERAREHRRTQGWQTSKLSPVLQAEGMRFEHEQLRELADGKRRLLTGEPLPESLDDLPFEDLSELLEGHSMTTEEGLETLLRAAEWDDLVIHQPPIEGRVGAYPIAGKPDVLAITVTEERIRIGIFEVKSTATEKVHHRYQAAIYHRLLDQVLDRSDLDITVAVVTPENPFDGDVMAPTTFDPTPYLAKLRMKLAEGGSFDDILLETPFNKTTNRIARRCAGCTYEAHCMTRAVERDGLELLGLQAGTQTALRTRGIATVTDFANLLKKPNQRAPWNYEPLETPDPELLESIRREVGVDNLQKRVEIAQRFSLQLDDLRTGAGVTAYQTALRGGGNNLPTDEHDVLRTDHTKRRGPDYPSGSLVRVYLYVQPDYAQNRVVLLSALVECSATGKSAWAISMPRSVQWDSLGRDREERRLFSTFFDRLGDAIVEVAPRWGDHPDLTAVGVTESEAFIHVFMYANEDRRALLDALRRHPTSLWARPLRTLLSLRESIDQQMVSVLQDDIRQRWAMRYPGLGILLATAHFYDFDGEGAFDWDSEAPLSKVFRHGLFDGALGVEVDDHRIRLDHGGTAPLWRPRDPMLKGDRYPAWNREVTKLPVEYIWGALGALDATDVIDPAELEPYLYADGPGSRKIDLEDIRQMVRQFTRAVRHIERSLEHNNIGAKDDYVEKVPIDLDRFAGLEMPATDIDQVCLEYLDLEFHRRCQQTDAQTLRPIAERIDSGQSIAIRIDKIDETQEYIEATIVDHRGTPIFRADESAQIDPLVLSADDFAVLSPLVPDTDTGNLRLDDIKPTKIARSPICILDGVDPESGRVDASVPFEDGWWNGAFIRGHYGWTTSIEADGNQIYFGEGEYYIIDPMADMIPETRAREAIVHAREAPMRERLRHMSEGKAEPQAPHRLDRQSTGVIIDQILDSVDTAPNREKLSFIGDLDHDIVSLQGPPGTGKTRFAMAPALLARIAGSQRAGTNLNAMVATVSHKAADEALQGLLSFQESLTAEDIAPRVRFVRVSPTPVRRDDDAGEVIAYHSDPPDVLEDVWASIQDPTDPRAVILLGPPSSIRGFLKKVIPDEMDDAMVDGSTEIFDLVFIDEASMMGLPMGLMCASFLRSGGQLALIGDHRQLGPIQIKDWSTEDRVTIEEHTPFLSVLDFIRFVRGDTVDVPYIRTDPPEYEDPEAIAPIHRLQDTYRLPSEAARMHTDLFYRRDGIELTSQSESSVIPFDDPALDSSARVTLIVHDEGRSQKQNPLEAALVRHIIRHADLAGERTAEDLESRVGVVVPFRAQRRLIQQQYDLQEVTVDTVERFQGGERELVILSMTASDRGYISQVAEFLLDANRLNVAASRMQRKLVVIAGAAIFEESDDDVDEFRRHRPWIDLLESMGGIVAPDEWTRAATVIDADLLDGELGDANLSIRHGYDPDRDP
jgi:uncharacterized protein